MLATVLLWAGITAILPAAEAPPARLTTEQEITLLISLVENSECHFHRNGARHDAAAGADHLRLKLRRGSKYAQTTEDFIRNLATKSSWSGKPYQIEHPDGRMEPLADWLQRELVRLRTVQSPTG
jgi:hypothetical protein